LKKRVKGHLTIGGPWGKKTKGGKNEVTNKEKDRRDLKNSSKGGLATEKTVGEKNSNQKRGGGDEDERGSPIPRKTQRK